MWKCKHCQQEFNFTSFSEKGNHTKWCEKNPKRNTYSRDLETARNSITKESRIKGAKTLSNSWKKGKYKDADFSKSFKNKSHSEKTKKLLSQKRKKYLLENPDKHPWKKNSKFTSEPCEFLKDKLTNMGIKFEEEYQPIKTRFFSLDIAFPDQKIGLEINGHQHYNKDGTLRSYYQERHDLIRKEGWNLIEIPYNQVYNEEIMRKIIQMVKF